MQNNLQSKFYVPLLEGKSGKLYLKNSALGFYYAGIPGGVSSANPATFLSSGVLAISSYSQSTYQGRLALQQNPSNSSDKRFELQYNGAAWDANMADDFSMNLVCRDVAFSTGGSQYDLYNYSPGPPIGVVDVYYDRRGGSGYDFYVRAKAIPTPISFSPSSIPADGQPHIITVTLKTRLHSSQSPTMQFALVDSGAPTVTLGSPVPIRNSAGQITGYTISVTANNQPSASGHWRLSASENIEYLKNDTIVTETVTYYTNYTFSNALTVQQATVAEPLKVYGASFSAGAGVDAYWGKLESGTGGRFAGGLFATVKVSSGAPLGSEFIEVWAKPTSGGSREVVLGYYGPPVGSGWSQGSAGLGCSTGDFVDGETLSQGGSTLYTRAYHFSFDTSDKMDSAGSWDFGYSVWKNNKVEPAIESAMFTGSRCNGNLTNNYGAYNVQLWAGQTVPGEWTGGWSTSTTPAFAGVVTCFLSENWNAYETGSGSTSPFFDEIKYRIDGGSWVSLSPSALSTSMLASAFSGGGGTSGGGGGGGGCVPAGTPVLTEKGWKAVETVKIGDMLVGFDDVTLRPIITEVTNFFTYEKRQLMTVVTENGAIVCSTDHRLAVNGEKFEYPSSVDLVVGSEIMRITNDGKTLVPTKVVELVVSDNYEDVYHFTLEKGHVYVAGGFAAHNFMKSRTV